MASIKMGCDDSPISSVVEVTTDADASAEILATESRLQVFHTGTLTADRVLSLGTANAQTGAAIGVTRTGAGAFNLSIAGLKNLATNEWCEVVYDGSTGCSLLTESSNMSPANPKIQEPISPEMAAAKVEHLRSEGRVSSDDETAMKLAEAEEEKSSAYGAVLRVLAEHLGE